MARIQPDFSEAVQFGECVPGLYKLQVVSSSAEKSREKGTRMINWGLTIVERIKGGDDVEIGRELQRRTPIEGKGAGFLEQFLKALGRTDLAMDKGKAWDTDEIHGMFVGADIGNRSYKDEASGEDRVAPEIRKFFKVDAGAESEVPF